MGIYILLVLLTLVLFGITTLVNLVDRREARPIRVRVAHQRAQSQGAGPLSEARNKEDER